MIGWLDPALGSANAGDEIIAEAVRTELGRIRGTCVTRLPTRRPWSDEELAAGRSCDLFVVGGTNLLTSHPLRYRQWHVGTREFRLLRGRVVLLGVGWWQYQDPPDVLARVALGQLLHPEALHSVRDTYTVDQLSRVQRRVTDTSCPTLWSAVPSGRTSHRFRSTVVATVTDYLRDPAKDEALLRGLQQRADRLLLWPQGDEDRMYITNLGFGGCCIPRGVGAFDEVLGDSDVEYVGTRLHAGIRALQHGVPAVVISIDNRAREISATTGLWTISRAEVDHLDKRLDAFTNWSLDLPWSAIAEWRDDLASLAHRVGGTRRLRST